MRDISQKVHTGDKYGRWEVIEYRPRKSLCKCLCGRTVQLVPNGALFFGSTTCCKSCGLEKCHEAHKGTEWRKVCRGMPWHIYKKLFTAVNNAYTRCTDPTYHQWKDYGGRGIKVLFENRESFIEHLASLPGHDDGSLVLDRRNNNGHYEPGNLRFVTRRVSNLNRRSFPRRGRRNISSRAVTSPQTP